MGHSTSHYWIKLLLVCLGLAAGFVEFQNAEARVSVQKSNSIAEVEQILEYFQSYGLENSLFVEAESRRPLPISKLIETLRSTKIIFDTGLTYSDGVRCYHEFSGRAVLGEIRINLTAISRDDVRPFLILHELLQSMGYSDDDSSVTAAAWHLLARLYTEKTPRTASAVSELMSQDAWLLKPLRNLRKGKPLTFKREAKGRECKSSKGTQVAGGGTFVGSGGDGNAILMKTSLLMSADRLYTRYFPGQEVSRDMMIRAIQSLIVEPMDHEGEFPILFITPEKFPDRFFSREQRGERRQVYQFVTRYLQSDDTYAGQVVHRIMMYVKDDLLKKSGGT